MNVAGIALCFFEPFNVFLGFLHFASQYAGNGDRQRKSELLRVRKNMPSDIEIAQAATPELISEIAKKVGIKDK